jgi:predicted chitinase
VTATATDTAGSEQHGQGRRRGRQRSPRRHRVGFVLADAEYAAVAAAARQAGLSRGAYAAQVVLAAAQGSAPGAEEPLRAALAELMHAANLVHRIGVNLNQAVAKLNATGQRPGDLLPYAAESVRRARHLDQIAGQVRNALE